MGLMRRGGISSLLGSASGLLSQMNRTWVRKDATPPTLTSRRGEGTPRATTAMKTLSPTSTETTGREGWPTAADEDNNKSRLDPAQLLALRQCRIEVAKAHTWSLKSSENAGRIPCLFSKRTGFNIHMDQIEDKPWDRGGMGPDGAIAPAVDVTDYFNYGMTKEDWLEYSKFQLSVCRQKRLPDAGIVPVVARTPRVQGDRVAVWMKKEKKDDKEKAAAAMDAKARNNNNANEDKDEDNNAVEFGVELSRGHQGGGGQQRDR
ncbi:hypothetical protein ACHAW5_008955 [Stephanodiscus triporus]|uniref:Pre-mRNA polyadenylation factor Fip1 domain-containing protein n=1 Tax=Stephanodiscus triporus TaxID=2934178 RepID=A0ABD3NSU8_9STRA